MFTLWVWNYQDLGRFKQCTTCPQFVAATHKAGMLLLDLKNVTVTNLLNPLRELAEQSVVDSEEESLRVFPGYIGNSFDVR